MHRGVVKKFDDAQGFGFIRSVDFEEDIFVHHKSIQMEGFKSLSPGQPVLFEVDRRSEGLIATKVVPGTPEVTQVSKSAEELVGTVKWFNVGRGFGFIKADALEEDIYVHHTYIIMNGYRSLAEGQQVVFTPEQTSTGIHAKYVKPASIVTGPEDNALI